MLGEGGQCKKGSGWAPQVDEEQVKGLPAKVRELTVANYFVVKLFKLWAGK